MSGHESVMHDDASDAAGALSGDAEAYARLYDRHAAVVLSLCRRSIPRGLAEADDAMQETFIRAFRLLNQLDDPTRFRSWIYGIARNVCSERRRSAVRRSKHEAQAMNATTTANPLGRSSCNGQVGAESRVETAEELDMLGRAIDQLDEDERLAVHLFYLQEESAPQAMKSMPAPMSRSHFYKLLARARQKLAALMNIAAADEAGPIAPTERVV